MERSGLKENALRKYHGNEKWCHYPEKSLLPLKMNEKRISIRIEGFSSTSLAESKSLRL